MAQNERVTIPMPTPLRQRLEKIAEKDDRSLAAVIRLACLAYVRRNGGKA